jgi:hypothetical protein
VAAVHDYETQMIQYGFDAVVKSRKQLDGNGAIHRPVVGRAVLAGMRTGMRLVNHLPPIKRRMAQAQQRYRGADRQAAWPESGRRSPCGHRGQHGPQTRRALGVPVRRRHQPPLGPRRHSRR